MRLDEKPEKISGMTSQPHEVKRQTSADSDAMLSRIFQTNSTTQLGLDRFPDSDSPGIDSFAQFHVNNSGIDSFSKESYAMILFKTFMYNG